MSDKTLIPRSPLQTVKTPVPRYLATIVFHPNQDLIGASAPLPEIGGSLEISRNSTGFYFERKPQPYCLGDRYISRKPLTLTPGRTGLELALHPESTPVYVDGETLYSQMQLDYHRLKQGVMLDFHRRVLIMLHAKQPRADDVYLPSLLGVSDGIGAVRSALAKVADLDLPVLIRGESGTGKELVAQAIHQLSRRRQQRFLAVNISAVAESLVIAELFGAKKGAFTGANADKPGLFQQADKGSLFLDEVGDARDDVQLALLRALETQEIRPVGSQDAIKVDIRIIAATDADLEEKLRDKRFRNPLLQRLAGFEIWLPPLRERRVDIGLLLTQFLRQAAQELGCEALFDPENLEFSTFWRKFFLQAISYDWPGNVRQLRNVAQQVLVNNRGSADLTLPEHLVNLFGQQNRLLERPRSRTDVAVGNRPETSAESSRMLPPRRKPSNIGDDELIAALENNRYDLKNTAEDLGISRAALYKMVESHPEFHKAGDLSIDQIAGCFHATGGDLDRMVAQLKVSKAALKRRLKEIRLI